MRNLMFVVVLLFATWAQASEKSVSIPVVQAKAAFMQAGAKGVRVPQVYVLNAAGALIFIGKVGSSQPNEEVAKALLNANAPVIVADKIQMEIRKHAQGLNPSLPTLVMLQLALDARECPACSNFYPPLLGYLADENIAYNGLTIRLVSEAEGVRAK
jgi:hypothetical protein